MFTIHNDADAPADDQKRYERLLENAIPLAAERLSGVTTRRHLPDEPEPSALFTQLSAESPFAGAYDLGEQFVAVVHTYGGHALIERLLKDEDLLPTNREIQDPQAWLNRHQFTG
ncbi:hypothetical protein [Kitasatospora sp. NPDC087314]|uniref:hypothetical protein n=1 Tax=Kitasatospora sp. NPDC087314 TaxID=3364068 RepID=UPI0038234E0B